MPIRKPRSKLYLLNSTQVLNKDSKASNGSANANGSAVRSASDRSRGLSKVVDVTIAYPDGRPLNLVSIATGWDPPCATHVHYR